MSFLIFDFPTFTPHCPQTCILQECETQTHPWPNLALSTKAPFYKKTTPKPKIFSKKRKEKKKSQTRPKGLNKFMQQGTNAIKSFTKTTNPTDIKAKYGSARVNHKNMRESSGPLKPHVHQSTNSPWPLKPKSYRHWNPLWP